MLDVSSRSVSGLAHVSQYRCDPLRPLVYRTYQYADYVVALQTCTSQDSLRKHPLRQAYYSVDTEQSP